MSRRLDALLSIGAFEGKGFLPALLAFLQGQWRMWTFYWHDVRPAIAERRRSKREDVISHLIAEGYSKRAILAECVIYGAAGMVTTREFITVAAWHLMEEPALRKRFLTACEEGQMAILEEILRLEPVVGMLYRKGHDAAAPDQITALDIRSANTDETIMGACPHRLDPDRERLSRVGGAGLAFGDGTHRCPGADVAIHESRIFLDRLMRLPGIRLERTPDIGWNPVIAGYELRGAAIACDPLGS
jgi:cytochrome P450